MFYRPCTVAQVIKEADIDESPFTIRVINFFLHFAVYFSPEVETNKLMGAKLTPRYCNSV
jgi:hypothetical protein